MNWQKILSQGFSSTSELLSYLELPTHLGNVLAEQQFKTRVPRGFAARMQKGNPADPLLLQVLALDKELIENEGYSVDPLVEAKKNPHQGLLHKYQGRVLLTLTGACAIHCRYCFRRHFPYEENNPGRKGWDTVLDYIRADSTIHEVILSGGDPLLATNVRFRELLTTLEAIPHIRTLRIHTRIPIVLPERLDQEFLNLLKQSRLKKVVVLHSNHSQEINQDVKEACFVLQQQGCHLLNQSVLLKGVNDNVEVLAQLSHTLFDAGVLPYYLHVLDKVKGTAHFDQSEESALTLYRQLQTQLPGYLVPRLAREEPGKASKTLLV